MIYYNSFLSMLCHYLNCRIIAEQPTNIPVLFFFFFFFSINFQVKRMVVDSPRTYHEVHFDFSTR